MTNEDDHLYAVEKIVKKNIDSNNVEMFKIRWLGYSSRDDWWMSDASCLPACYPLIKDYEASQFKRRLRKNLIPEIIGFKKVENQLKLLIRWTENERPQFYYSSAIQSMDPKFLIKFYEKYITISQLDNEWTHFLKTRVRNVELLDNDRPKKIIAIASCDEEKLCLVQWEENQDEATVVELEWIKEKHPSVLIEFYERHMVLKND